MYLHNMHVCEHTHVDMPKAKLHVNMQELRILHVDINKYVNMQKGTTCKNVTTCYMYSMNVDM